MSALTLDLANASAFQYPSRYSYHAAPQDDAQIVEIHGGLGKGARAVTSRGALQALGQYCAEAKNRGVLFPYEIHQVFAACGMKSRATRKRLRARLVETGALVALDDGYQLATYARHNRTPEEWAEVKRRRTQYQSEWQRKKRAEKRALRATLPPPTRLKVTTGVAQKCATRNVKSPGKSTLSAISGGDDSHYRGERSEPAQPLPSPDLSGLNQKPTCQRSDTRSEQEDLRAARLKCTQLGYTGGGKAKFGSPDAPKAAPEPVKQSLSEGAKEKSGCSAPTPRGPNETMALRSLSPDKSGFEKVGDYAWNICARMQARQRAEAALQSPPGGGVGQ